MRIFITLVSVFCVSLCSLVLSGVQAQQHQVSNGGELLLKGAYSDQLVAAPQLETILLSPQANLNYEKEAKQLKQHQLSNKKTLYKKLHKLVDELMKEEQSERRLDKQLNDFEQGKLVLVMKKKPSTSFTATEEEELAGPKQALAEQSFEQQRKSNTLDMLLGAQNTVDGAAATQVEQQVLARNLNSAEHARRILDDKFGIMKESKFSTNNHLGLKGVPKFGTEEEY